MGTQDNSTNDDDVDTTVEGQSGTGNDGASGDEVEDGSKDGSGTDGTESHEEVPADVLRANLTRANQEAAKYRTQLRDTQKALEAAKSPEEVEEIVQNLTAQNAANERNLLVEVVALRHNLPTELAAVLKGNTREELEEHAKTLAKFAPSKEQEVPGDLSGGLNPGQSNDEDGETALERVRRIKSRR